MRVAQALEVIRENYREPLTISDLATSCGLGRRRFAAAFRQVLGVTPYQYILNLRLRAAADRLRSDSGTVLQIGLDIGFGDLSEFTRRFHAAFGVPPGRFRQRTGDRSDDRGRYFQRGPEERPVGESALRMADAPALRPVQPLRTPRRRG